MEAFYLVLFALLTGTTAFLELTRGRDGSLRNANQEFFRFRNNYVLVYALMTAGDWLQGPYTRALYQHYGLGGAAVTRLLATGFASSLLLGTLAGTLADRLGRRRAALAYAGLAALACLTKHSGRLWVLVAGRAVSGVAASLLAACFEAWVVAEHAKRGYEQEWLGGLFAASVFVGSGLMGLLSGLVGHTLVDTLALGPVAPFDVAAVVLLLGLAAVLLTWGENYGEERGAQHSWAGALVSQLGEAAGVLRRDPKVLALGAIQALFEGALLAFGFLWAPALGPQGEGNPHGVIFACLMVACMGGSTYAGRLLANLEHHAVEHYMQTVFTFGALFLGVPLLLHFLQLEEKPPDGSESGVTWRQMATIVPFCGFQFVVGVCWPSLMQMRAKYVPERLRATLISLFRVPAVAFVCLVLYNESSAPPAYLLGVCSALLGAAALCQRHLFFLSVQHKVDIALRKSQEALLASPLR